SEDEMPYPQLPSSLARADTSAPPTRARLPHCGPQAWLALAPPAFLALALTWAGRYGSLALGRSPTVGYWPNMNRRLQHCKIKCIRPTFPRTDRPASPHLALHVLPRQRRYRSLSI